MNETHWARQQMSLRKLANQFLAKAKEAEAKRILVTSIKKGDGKALFISALASEMARLNQELVPIAGSNLESVSPDRFEDKLVVVYGPAFLDVEGPHTIPERWMRAFDAAVIMVMSRDTKSGDLVDFVNWLKDYGFQNIWPVLNEFKAPASAQRWLLIKSRLGLAKVGRYQGQVATKSFWRPVLEPFKKDPGVGDALTPVSAAPGPSTLRSSNPTLKTSVAPAPARQKKDWEPPTKVAKPRDKEWS
jgi:hypothetical protein